MGNPWEPSLGKASQESVVKANKVPEFIKSGVEKPTTPESKPYDLSALKADRPILNERLDELSAINQQRKKEDPSGSAWANTDEYYESFIIDKLLKTPDLYLEADKAKMLLKILNGKEGWQEERFNKALENVRTIIREAEE